MVAPIEPKRRSRAVKGALAGGVVVAGALITYGLTRSDDSSSPDSSIPPTIGVIQSPAAVLTTRPAGAPSGSGPATVDVPLAPLDSTDVAFPPVSSRILVP